MTAPGAVSDSPETKEALQSDQKRKSPGSLLAADAHHNEERIQVAGANPYRIEEPKMLELAGLAQPVHRRRADRQRLPQRTCSRPAMPKARTVGRALWPQHGRDPVLTKM